MRVTGGRKHLGKEGTVISHMESKYERDAFRYGGEASQHMRQMEGRYGYVVLVEPTNGGEGGRFWVKANNVECIEVRP